MKNKEPFLPSEDDKFFESLFIDDFIDYADEESELDE